MRDGHYYQVKNLFPLLKNPSKYRGRPLITCRSGWEIKFAKWCDANDSVVEWNSEEVVIRYFYPLDGKFHRYFVDYWIKVKQEDGSLKEYLVEVKPYSETIEPKIPKRKTKGYINRVNSFIKNTAKWDAARQYCKEQKDLGRNLEFMVLTEKEADF